MEIRFRDKNLEPIWYKVKQGIRLDKEDGEVLFSTSDLIALGKMASFVQKNLNGDAVYFIVNQKIEPTNICVHSCRFCKFSRKRGSPDAYEMKVEEILRKLSTDIQEVHITGALHPEWDWSYYLEILNQIKSNFPNINIKAFTAVEIDYFSRKFNKSIDDILYQLKNAGVYMLPGGGAEVFSNRVRQMLFPQKIDAERWLEIHRQAHKVGILTNATLLYGHVETISERVDHLLRLRNLQDETNGFVSFVPLAFQTKDSSIERNEGYGSAIDDLKMVAVSRLLLNNFPHIKAYWVTLTESVATVALNFGADDIEGTIGGERIAHDAGAMSASALTKEQIIELVKSANKIPVQRDIYYNPVNTYGSNVIGKIPYLNSAPFYENLEDERFKILPVVPRRMGILARKDQIISGLFSLVDYLEQKDTFELLEYCLATRDQVKSVLLFSNYGWKELDGKKIGISDASATSVKLLKVLLTKKYSSQAIFKRMEPINRNFSDYDGVLLIGDDALRHKKYGLAGFEIVYDLASEWYDWKKLPFVFAVWAVKKYVEKEIREKLAKLLEDSLDRAEEDFRSIGRQYAKRIGLTEEEIVEYLTGFNFRLGVRERESIEEFEKYLSEIKSYEQV